MQSEEGQYCSRCGGAVLESEGFPDCPSCGAQTNNPSTIRGLFPPPGLRFADYDVLEEIARGGMGVVYKARQRRLNRTVALKVMLPGIFTHPAQVQRFNAEAQIVAALNHPNIISVYEVGEEGGTYYFSMPLVQGVDLSKKGKIAGRTAARYVEKIAQAVYHAHQRGVLHRDLKPSNVLVDERDEPHVVDFGIAKHTADNNALTQTGESLGTPSYMAPEQVHADGTSISVATDIYALGGILYFLLTGRPPFAGGTREQILWAVFYDEPARPANLDPTIERDLETICLKCLAKNPVQRYATAGELAEDLRRFQNNEPISARPISTSRRAMMWAQRNPALAFSLLALIGALAYGVVAQQVALSKARKARADAETLIEFMDKELTTKLRPLGRLDLTGDVIRKAEAYFKDQDEANSGPGFLIRKASFFWRAGTLERDLGKLPEAEQMALKGMATLDNFQKSLPQDAEGWSLRASLNVLLFRIAESLGNKEQAREYATRGMSDQRKALVLAGETVEQSAKLAEILMDVSRFHRDQGEVEVADSLLKEATADLKAVVQQDPKNQESRRLLAITHYHRGLAHQKSHDNASALVEFKLFIQSLEEIAKEAEGDRDFQYELAVAYGRAASAHGALGDLEVSEALVTKWRDAAEKLAFFAPNNMLWRASYAQSLAWLGTVIRDQAEIDPRVPGLFQQAIDIYQQLSLLHPNPDQYLDTIDGLTANLVRFHAATDQLAQAENVLRINADRHLDLAVRFPERFSQQRRLGVAFGEWVQFLERHHRNDEAAQLCHKWIARLHAQFAGSSAPHLWRWAEASTRWLMGNLATLRGEYDESVLHWRGCISLQNTLTNSEIVAATLAERSYALKSLTSVQAKRGDLAAVLKAASDALDWAENSIPKPGGLVSELCLFVSGKVLILDDGSDEVNRFLARCRSQIVSSPAALEQFDASLKEREARGPGTRSPSSAGAPPGHKVG